MSGCDPSFYFSQMQIFRPASRGRAALRTVAIKGRVSGILHTIPDIGRFAIAERETLLVTSAARGAAVKASEVEDPGDKVRDLGFYILRSRSNSFSCRRVNGLVNLAE
jgi:hypothetical protein